MSQTLMRTSATEGIIDSAQLYGRCDRKSKSGFDAGARIEHVAQGVADEVEGEHGQHNSHRRKQHEMRRVEQDANARR